LKWRTKVFGQYPKGIQTQNLFQKFIVYYFFFIFLVFFTFFIFFYFTNLYLSKKFRNCCGVSLYVLEIYQRILEFFFKK